MKIYFNIDTPEKRKELQSFCLGNSVTFDGVTEGLGIYCLDNTDKELFYPGEFEVDNVPKSFRLEWNIKHIDDLYNNRVLARFNEGKLEWTFMNADAMAPMIQVLMYGAKKYDRNNWMKACPKRLSLMDSLQRHSLKIIAGESIDPESGLPHIGHLMCNAMFYSYWEQKTNGQFENFKDENK